MTWVLIFYVLNIRSAITSQSVRFYSKEACFQAKAQIEAWKDTRGFASDGVYAYAFCVEDVKK